jgi:RimJ/RimL family protein N-acetyltransferase
VRIERPLAGAQVVLREFVEADWEAFRRVAEDEAARRWDRDTVTGERARAFVARAIAAQTNPRRSLYEFAVVLKDTGELVGECDLGFAPGDAEAEAGLVIARAHRRRGLGREALRLLLAFGFGPLALARVYAYVDEDNRPAAWTFESAGFALEERERVWDKNAERWRDARRYAATAAGRRA